MKRILTISLLLTAAQITTAQESSCATLYHHGDRDITLCHTEEPESYTAYHHTGGQITSERITFEQYVKMMEEDTRNLQEQTARQAAATEQFKKDIDKIADDSRTWNRARAIRHKKDCTSAGFVWEHGFCTFKPDEARP